MAMANSSGISVTPVPSVSNPTANGTASSSNHHHHHHVHPHVHDHRPAPTPASAAAASKKAKNKRAMDSLEASKLVAARISQLEGDTAAEREQQDEIDREVKKHNRELASTTNKMNDLEKIDHLSKRCSELFASMKRHERESAKNKKRSDQLQKEKDASRNEASKQTGLKEKLEKLCRELQKENNKLKNDHRSLQDAHQKLKKDSDRRFEEVFKTLEGYQEEKDNPRKQVMNTKVEDLFKTRFKSLVDQYELRELHFHSQMRTKEIEVQYHMSRFEQQKKSAEAESARSRSLNTQVLTFHKTETELRHQLNVYVEKFKQEMEDMSKKTKKLEKENETLKRKNEALNQNIVTMADERSHNHKDLDATRQKNEKLTSIIKQMQQQGRGIPPGMQAAVDECYAPREGDENGELESEYEDEYEEGEDDGSDEGEFDDDTEEEVHEQANSTPAPRPTYGPEPPPASTTQPAISNSKLVHATTNGHI